MAEEFRAVSEEYGVKCKDMLGGDGFTRDEYFDRFNIGADWDSFLLLPAYTDVGRSDISLRQKLGPIDLAYPFITSPMRVTEARMARAAARYGGIGAIHVHLTIDEQVHELTKVKLEGLITSPSVLAPDVPVSQIKYLHEQYSNIPVTREGKAGGFVLGMIDKNFRHGPGKNMVQDCMREAIIVHTDTVLDKKGAVMVDVALRYMDKGRSNALAVVDARGNLKGIIVRSDISGTEDGSDIATVDEDGKLRVGAAVTTFREDYEERVPRLVEEGGVDFLVVDTAHGHSRFTIETITWLKRHYESVPVMAGNISTGSAALDLINAGADMLRVGNGSGSACLTHEVTGTGSSPVTAVYRVARVASRYNIPVVADGGIGSSGAIMRALALGASAVMCGKFFADLRESGCPTITEHGRTYKIYGGMASAREIAERVGLRYVENGHVVQKAEGTELPLPLSTKTFKEFIEEEMGGVRQGFYDVGARSIRDLHEKMDNGAIRMEYKPAVVSKR